MVRRRTIDVQVAKCKKRAIDFRVDEIMQALKRKLERENARGCSDVEVITDREWYRYFCCQLASKCEWAWEPSNSEEDKKPAARPTKEDKKPAAKRPKKDDDDHAQSLMILPFHPFGQGGGGSPNDYFSSNHAQLVALQSVPEAPSIAVTRNLPHAVTAMEGASGTLCEATNCAWLDEKYSLGDPPPPVQKN